MNSFPKNRLSHVCVCEAVLVEEIVTDNCNRAASRETMREASLKIAVRCLNEGSLVRQTSSSNEVAYSS